MNTPLPRLAPPVLGLVFVLLLTAACGKKAEEPPPPIPTRSDFSPEEFGMGRMHTRNAHCNRDIDAILNETRLCVNSGQGAACDAVREKNSGRIAQIKNSTRCQR